MSSSAERERSLAHVDAFDGLRAVAVLLVFMLHAGYGKYVDGKIGVDIFFALSGFLITTLLLQKYSGERGIRLGRFYAKRARRLLPALALLLLLYLVYGLLDPRAGAFRSTFQAYPFIILYTSNWFQVIRGVAAAGPLSHTWTLSVEEQFYLLWPLVLMLVIYVAHRRQWLLAVTLLGCVGALLARFLIANGPGTPLYLITRLEEGTDTNADFILFGCALAVLLNRASVARVDRVRRILDVAIWPALLFFVYIVFFDSRIAPGQAENLRFPISRSLVAIMSAVFVGHLLLSPASPLSRVLAVRPLRYIGQVSYGWYLYHVPLFAVAVIYIRPYSRPLGFVIVFAATLALSSASFFLVERPIRNGTGWRLA